MDKILKKCIDYHGHKCLGLLIGYRASRYAMNILKEKFARDEEIVAIVENSSCFVDAVSVVTGCTFGKGNLIFKDYGKMALSLISRTSGKGVRIYVDGRKIKRDERFIEIMNKVIKGKADEKELKIFGKMKRENEKKFMTLKDDEIFIVREYKNEIPQKARIYKSVECERCGELCMETKIEEIGGKKFCIECFNSLK